MQYHGYNAGNIILTEGDFFPFRILNLIQLQDNEWYYILKDINGLKHFMPAEYYKNYGFTTGDEIVCKIDKINCTGRIFLEPEHPFYKIGEVYNFAVISCTGIGNEIALFVREKSGNSIEVPICFSDFNSVNEENKVNCIVKSIKKGMPILEIHPKF